MNSAFLYVSWEKRGVRKNCSELMWALEWVWEKAGDKLWLVELCLLQHKGWVNGPMSLCCRDPRSRRCRDTDSLAGLCPFLVSSACPWWTMLWSSPAALQLGHSYPWLGRQKSPNSMTFSFLCLFPEDHVEGPRITAEVNLMVTLWWAGFAALCELCQLRMDRAVCTAT